MIRMVKRKFNYLKQSAGSARRRSACDDRSVSGTNDAHLIAASTNQEIYILPEFRQSLPIKAPSGPILAQSTATSHVVDVEKYRGEICQPRIHQNQSTSFREDNPENLTTISRSSSDCLSVPETVAHSPDTAYSGQISYCHHMIVESNSGTWLKIDGGLSRSMLNALHEERKLRVTKKHIWARHKYLERLFEHYQAKSAELVEELNEAATEPQKPLNKWKLQLLVDQWEKVKEARKRVKDEDDLLRDEQNQLDLQQRALDEDMNFLLDARLTATKVLEPEPQTVVIEDEEQECPVDLGLLENIDPPTEEELRNLFPECKAIDTKNEQSEKRTKRREISSRFPDSNSERWRLECVWNNESWLYEEAQEYFDSFRLHAHERYAQWCDNLRDGEDVPQTKSEFDRHELITYGKLTTDLVDLEAKAEAAIQACHDIGHYPDLPYGNIDEYAPGLQEEFDAVERRRTKRHKIEHWLDDTRSLNSSSSLPEIDQWDSRVVKPEDSISCHEEDVWARNAIDDWKQKCEKLRDSWPRENMKEEDSVIVISDDEGE